MPERLARAVQQFADDVGRLHTPLAVLVALQNVSQCTVGVELLGAWALPRYFKAKSLIGGKEKIYFFIPMCRAAFGPII
jgi:hypothetical protein